MADLKETLKKCVELYNSGKYLEAFKKWKGVLETEIEFSQEDESSTHS